jgi:membrane protease YdiL (CAAX protease family)
MASGRAAARVFGVVVLFLALRELIATVDGVLWSEWPARRTWAAVPLYAMWAAALALATIALPRELRATWWRGEWRRPELIAFALAFVANEWVYGAKLLRCLAGDLTFHAPTSWSYLVAASVAAPVIEEWLFRGALWNVIAAQVPRRAAVIVALLVTSTLFGVWHWVTLFQPSWHGGGGTHVLVHIGYGAMLGVLRIRLGCIGGGIALHALGNTWSVVS